VIREVGSSILSKQTLTGKETIYVLIVS